MEFWTYLPLIPAVSNLLLIFLVLRSGWRHGLHRVVAHFLLALAIWAFAVYGLRASPTLEHALLWQRVALGIGPFGAVLYYHFTVLLTRPTASSAYNRLITTGYLLVIALLCLLATDLLVAGNQMKFYGPAPILGKGFFFYIALLYFFVLLGVVNLWQAARHSPSHQDRNRAAYIIMGTACFLCGGLSDFLPVLGFNIYPMGVVGNLLFCLFVAAAIIRHQLLDIRIMIRRGLAYGIVSAVVIGAYVGIIFLFTVLSGTQRTSLWANIAAMFLLAIVLQPVLRWVQRLVDRLFYRDRYDYLKALEQFGRETQSIANPHELGSNLVQLVTGALRTASSCLLLPANGTRRLVVTSSVGLEDPPPGTVLDDRSLFLRWLRMHGRTISSREIEINPGLRGMTNTEKQNLEKLRGDLYVPIMTRRGELSGVLVLGEKLGQEPYSSEDRQLLATLAGQMAMAFENATLYRRSLQEVSERKQAEEQLRSSEQKLRLTFESMAEGIVVTDLDANIVQANEAVVRMHGYADREDLVGRSILSLVARKDHSTVMAGLETTLEDGHARDLVCTFLASDETEFPVRLNTAILKGAAEDPTGFVVITEDITEQKRMEEQLRHSQLLASLGEMTAGIAHEVNNPLQSVLLYSDLLMTDESPTQSKRDLRILRNEARRAARIMTDLLTYSRRAKSHERRLDLHRVIKRVLAMRRYAQTVRNITVTTDLTDGPLPVKGDSSQLTQVFMNLIVNAVEALTESEKKFVVVTSTVDGEWVRVSIADSGTGIPAENLNQVFYPFFTTKQEVKGTGLGLSTCYGIVTGHGGLVRASNNHMGGATFSVELPLATNGSHEKPAEKPTAVAPLRRQR